MSRAHGRGADMAQAVGRADTEAVLQSELSRQRRNIRRMRDVEREVADTLGILRALVADPAFVALMRSRGFDTIPSLLQARMAEEG